MKQLNPSLKLHFLLGVFISVWIFLFAFFIRPFEHGTMDFEKWVYVSIGFSFIAFTSYGILALVQKRIYQKTKIWNAKLEVFMLLLFYVLYTLGTYFYYKSPFVEGFYNFWTFFTEIILIAALILTPILILLRIYALKLLPKKSDLLTIKGENKLDILKIRQSSLICISNSQNYVEIFYIENDELRSKLIRSSLKNIQSNLDFLVQIHRSHLINPVHFKAWKDTSTIELTKMELPVSKNYKERVLAL